MSASVKSAPLYEKPWFEAVFLIGGVALAAVLSLFLAKPDFLSVKTLDAIAMAKLLAEGEYGDVFARMSHPPVYPLILAGIMKLKDSTDVSHLMRSFQQLNLMLYAVSIGLVYAICKQHLKKPYTYLVATLYALAPTTVAMAHTVSADMTFTVMSLTTILVIDYCFGKKPGEAVAMLTRGEMIACGVSIALTVLTRQIGYILLVAYFFLALRKFGLQKSCTTLAIIVLAMSPFIGRDLYHVLKEPAMMTASSTELIHDASSPAKGFDLFKKQADNIFFQSTHHAVGELNLGVIPRLLGASESNLWFTHFDFSRIVWLRWTLGIMLLLGVFCGISSYSGIGSIYLLTYAISSFVILPDQGISLAPVLPFLLIYCYLGLYRLNSWATRIHVPLMKFAGPALTVVILVCTLTTHLTFQLQRGVSYPQMLTAYENLSVAGEDTARVADARADDHEKKDGAKDRKSGKKKKRGDEPVDIGTANVMMAVAESEAKPVKSGGKAPVPASASSSKGRDKALAWLAVNADKDARIAAPRARAVDEITQARQTPAMINELRQYDYLVEENVTLLNGRKNQNPGLKLVYTDPTAGVRIWRVKPENLPSAE